MPHSPLSILKMATGKIFLSITPGFCFMFEYCHSTICMSTLNESGGANRYGHNGRKFSIMTRYVCGAVCAELRPSQYKKLVLAWSGFNICIDPHSLSLSLSLCFSLSLSLPLSLSLSLSFSLSLPLPLSPSLSLSLPLFLPLSLSPALSLSLSVSLFIRITIASRVCRWWCESNCCLDVCREQCRHVALAAVKHRTWPLQRRRG